MSMSDSAANYKFYSEAVKSLAQEVPGITFGYIGNVGVYRSGPFDDRSWYVFLPHPGRVGTISDRVFVGHKGLEAVQTWESVERQVRRMMASREGAL